MKMPTSKFHNNEKPLFHSAKASHQELTLFLDFNKKDKLQGLYYTSEGGSAWFTELSALSKEVEGKTFSELQKEKLTSYQLPAEVLFDLPRFLLKSALEIYRGKSPALYKLKSQPEEDLICRCFGIYKGELLELLEQFPEYSSKELSNATKAGAGCSSCLSDFPVILGEAKARQAKRLLNS